jgi:hypothetical protein
MRYQEILIPIMPFRIVKDLFNQHLLVEDRIVNRKCVCPKRYLFTRSEAYKQVAIDMVDWDNIDLCAKLAQYDCIVNY